MGNGILGIDIGRNGIKAVQVAVGLKGRYRISAAEEYDFRSEGNSPDAFAGALARLCSDERFRGSLCAASLPAEFFSFRTIRLPFRDGRKIRQTLNFELEPLLPFPIDAVATDFTVVEQGDESDILAAAVSKDALAGRLHELEPFNVRLVEIDTVPVAAGLISAAGPADGSFILLDIGAAGTTAVFSRRGRIFQVRTFSFGGDAITGAVSNSLKIGFEEAERRKRTGDFTADPALAEEAGRLCDQFCGELDHTLQFLKLRRSDEKPSKIYVTGGGAGCGLVIDSLRRRFSLPVETVDLRMMRQISIPSELSGSWNPLRMNGALALALRGAGRTGGFNFRRKGFEGAGVVRLFTRNLRQAAAVLLTVAGILTFDSAAGYFIDQRHLANLKSESERILRAASPEITRVVDPVQQLKARIAEARKYSVGGNAGALELLKKISEAVPAEVSFLISDLNYDGDKMEIRGETSDFDAVETIKRKIAASGPFRNVSVSGANLVKGKNRVEFEVRMTCAR